MSTQRSDSLAELLREQPPSLDDLTRARMEKRLIAAAAPRPTRSSSKAPAIAIASCAVALAAAVALVVLSDRDSQGAAPIARFERGEAAASLERGTLEEGSSLRTAAHEVAQIHVEASRVRIGGDSRVRIVELAHGRLALELGKGTVEVAFHPREPGRDLLTVETPEARVEVVGTVFRVTARGGATEVSVSEGTVRVVPLAGGAPRLVHTGESTRIGALEDETARAHPLPHAEGDRGEGAAQPPNRDTPTPTVLRDRPSQPAEPFEPSGPSEETETRTPPPSPAARLEEARRAIGAGRSAAGLRMLRDLTRPPAPVDVRVEAWMMTADVHLGAGRLAEAASAYESAAQEGHGTAGGHNAIYSLARLQHRRLGDRGAARATYERYLREAPNGALAQPARRALCSLGAAEHCEEP